MLGSGEAGEGGAKKGETRGREGKGGEGRGREGKGGEVPPDSKPDEWISFSVD